MIACSDDDDPTPPKNQEDPYSPGIIPLRIGNYWLYQETHLQDETTATVKWEVTDTLQIDETIIFELSYERNDMPQAERHYVRNQSEGLFLYRHRRNDGTYENFEPPTLMLKYPAQENQLFLSWWTNDARLRAKNKNVGVPAGAFNCLKYELNFETSMRSTYWTPGSGMIMESEYLFTENGTIHNRKWELIDYEK